MMRKTFTTLMLLFAAFFGFSQAPEIEWENTIGGIDNDYLMCIQQTTDGGYILGGYSAYNISGDKTENSNGLSDYWVVKLDASGNKIWENSFGGSDNDTLTSLQQTSDGGYIVGGISLSGISGNKTNAGCQKTHGVGIDGAAGNWSQG